ncbi:MULTISPECIES: DUF1330 domain-containing protein [Acinetobacter]|uniref:DUF1330 domain-containing protein n=1 Tax=Acinetobacter TaxID=469 RepID=UPI0006E2D74F|nr:MULTISPECIES: DUF1330 domain-containing protein [Acinetobacter]KQC98336.1 hypothetical protein APD01_09895 [Acinetobacter soli]MCL9677644.1 DUF1330 domain-containing protein [Acinetobacter sp. ACZLY 512]WEH92791.1 DUF1330 domain-containing protein [Acinetobacter soli]WEH98025.1 DUF1330 domain-containing protein [Acinetobacter soli]WEI01398.1 DUF1330 domain-containing protein [Acinetobacter soli]
MSAYVVFTRESTSDAEQMAQYAEKAPLAREGRDLTPLAFYGKFEVLEGSDIEGAVILRFPDMAAAREWYNSQEYQDALQHRLKGANYRVFIIEGLKEPV